MYFNFSCVAGLSSTIVDGFHFQTRLAHTQRDLFISSRQMVDLMVTQVNLRQFLRLLI